LNDSENTELTAIEQQGKTLVNVNGKKGYVYFFKYKMQTDDAWQIAISGQQPENLKTVNTNSDLTILTNEKLTADKSATEQFNEQLMKLILKQHKSAAHFFGNDTSVYTGYDDYDN
jgi:hypothetical protein